METEQDFDGFAVRYARWSTGVQEGGDTLRRQDGKFAEFCRRFKLKPLPGYEHPIDRGVSAYKSANIQRGSLADFLIRVKEGQIPRKTVLVVENVDRLSRDKISVVLNLFQQLISAGIRIGDCLTNHIVDEEGLNDPLILMSIIMGAVRAHEHSKVLGIRMKSSWNAKMENARTTKVSSWCPHWLNAITHTEVLPDGRRRRVVDRYEIDQEKAGVIREIFALAVEGKGSTAIADILEARGAKTAKGGERWLPNVVLRTLRDRAVLGEFQGHQRIGKYKSSPVGDPVPNYYPHIIMQEVFDKVDGLVNPKNFRRAGRPSKPQEVNIFGGLLVDPEGRPFHIVSRHPLKHRILRSTYGKGPRVCYQKMEHSFFLCINDIEIKAFFHAQTGGEIEGLRAKLASIDARIAKFEQMMETASDDDEIERLTKNQTKADKDRKVILGRLQDAEMKARSPIEVTVKSLQESPRADPTMLRARIRLCVEKIVLTVNTVKFAKRPWKVADVQVYFRGDYTKTYSFIYANSAGHLDKPLEVSDAARFAGHDVGPFRGLIDDGRKQCFLSVALKGAIIRGATDKELAEWEGQDWSAEQQG
jgi:DNA invertase Pin-like site-specific DNA recombinase